MSESADMADRLAWQMQVSGMAPPEREHKFHPRRRWRLDLSYPALKVAFEVEGGVWSEGRHTRGSGFIGDCEKYNEATLLGWRVYRIPADWVKDGSALRLVERVLKVTR
jgi:hypothetical protein